jgi:hypothetical protein
VAAQLTEDPALEVHRRKGKLGELRVAVDGTDVVDTLLYPLPGTVVARVRSYLAAAGPDA